MRFIGETAVSESMLQAAQVIKRRGGKAFLVLAGMASAADACQNCHGVGHLALQVITGGPFDSARSGSGNRQGKSRDDQPEEIRVNIWHDGRWYTAKSQSYECPVCDGGRRVVRIGPTQRYNTAGPLHAAVRKLEGK